MALATRPKPTAQHKKRLAQHHRHSKTYVKAYWPYIPMLTIVGAGAYVNQHWSSSPFASGGTGNLNPPLTAIGPVTRIQALTNDQTGWVLLAVIAVSTLAFTIFILRHSYRLHRAITKGEAYISHHPWLDIATVFVFTAGLVVTRVTGLFS